MQAREQMINKRKVVKQELDVQVQARNQRLAEVREMDKLYGAAFQMKIEQDSKQHQDNVAASKKYVVNDPLIIVTACI